MEQIKPFVSVIIPTYNSSGTIVQAIDSVFNQTEKGIEVIVVDDGSTDGTREALAGLAASGAIVYIRQDNQGCGAARNHGAMIAKGEYVAFLDADDYWHEEKIARQLAAFRSDQNCIVCYTDSYEVDPYGAVIWNVRKTTAGRLHSGHVLGNLAMRNFITLSSATAHADAFRKVGGFVEDQELMMFADYDLWLKLAPTGMFSAIDMPLAFYRTRLPISRKEKISNHRKVMGVFALRLEKSDWKGKPWYLVGLCISTCKWAVHLVLQLLGI